MSEPAHAGSRVARFADLVTKWVEGEGDTPTSLEVLVSARCNARCRMCNVWRLPTVRPSLSDDEIPLARLETLAVEAALMGVRTVQVSGGEPLLRTDIAAILSAFKQAGMKVLVFTNGTQLLRPGLIPALVEAGPDYLVTSLDSSIAAKHDEIRGRAGFWDRTTAGLRALAAERERVGSEVPRVKLMSCVSHDNTPEVFDLRQMVPELGAELAIFNPLQNKIPGELDDSLLTEEDLQQIERLGAVMGPADQVSFYRKNLCFAPYKQMSIDPFGKVYPCCFAQGFLNLNDDLTETFWGEPDRYALGDITEQSLAEVWNGEPYRRFRRSLHSLPRYGMCAQCNQPPAQPWTRLQPVFRAIAAGERLLGVDRPIYRSVISSRADVR